MPDSPGLEALFVRLSLDRHIMTRLALDLRGRGYDVLTTQEAGKDTAPDEEQLAFATAERRALLTFNVRGPPGAIQLTAVAPGWSRRRSSSATPPIGTRHCSVLSRSRMVTVSPLSVSPSIVIQNGVPASSWRR